MGASFNGFKRFFGPKRASKGATGFAYGLIVGLIGVVALLSVDEIGSSVSGQLCGVSGRLAGGQAQACNNGNGGNPNSSPEQVAGPAVTGVSVTPGIYQTGATISLTVNFDEDVSIQGQPRLQLQLDTGTVLADLNSGDGTSSVEFTYTVNSGDRAEVSAVIPSNLFNLSAGSIVSVSDGESFAGSLSAPLSPAVRVNPVNIGPAITGWDMRFNGDREPGKVGETVSVTLSIAPSVTITGTPNLSLQVGELLKLIPMSSSTATSLRFTYIITEGDIDNNGIEINRLALDLSSGGSIVDANTGIAAELVIPQSTIDQMEQYGYSEKPEVDTRVRALSTRVPDGNYLTGQVMPIEVTYPEAVTVSGAPVFTEFSDQGIQGPSASYLSGSGTTKLTFGYTVRSSDNDSDAVAFSGLDILGYDRNTGDLDGATITTVAIGAPVGPFRDSFFEAFPGAIVNQSETPEITGLGISATNDYDPNGIGNQITFTISFNRNIAASGNPGFAFSMGGTAKSASYVSASGKNATFRYTIVAGDFDSNGITPTGLDHSSGQITSATSGTAADTTISQEVLNNSYYNAPVVETRLVADSISIPIGNYETGEIIPISVHYPEPVNVSGSPTFTEFSDQGVSGPSATYASGSGSGTLIFNYTVKSGDNDNDGFAFSGKRILGASSEGALTGGTITKVSDGTGVGPLRQLNFERFGNVFLNQGGTAPQVTGVQASNANDPFYAGAQINISVGFSTSVVMENTPRLQVNLGGNTVYFPAVSASGSSVTFRHTVAAGEYDLNGAQVVGLDFSQGRIYSSIFGDDANTVIPSEATEYLDQIKVEGRNRITAITVQEGTFRTGDTVAFTVHYASPVNVSGSPTFTEFSDQSLAGPSASYASGSGSTSLTFNYTVQSSDGPQGYGNVYVEFSGYRILGHDAEGAITGGSITDASSGDAVSPWRDHFFSSYSNTFINPPIVE